MFSWMAMARSKKRLREMGLVVGAEARAGGVGAVVAGEGEGEGEGEGLAVRGGGEGVRTLGFLGGSRGLAWALGSKGEEDLRGDLSLSSREALEAVLVRRGELVCRSGFLAIMVARLPFIGDLSALVLGRAEGTEGF